MNSLYIGIGVAIIAVLVAALVGPHFVEWNAYRSVFEREGQRIFGAEVTVLGDVKVQLLPMPSLTLEDVVIGPVDQPDMKVARIDLNIEVTPLLKGEVRIAELRLDRPLVRIGLDKAGRGHVVGLGRSATGSADMAGVGLELAEIVDGKLELYDERSDSSALFDGINATASAERLTGPIRIEGGANYDGHGLTFRFSASKRGDDGVWPMRMQVNPVEAPYQVSIEAMVDPLAVRPSARGTVVVQRLAANEGKGDKFETQPTPWQLDTAFAADSARISLDTINLTVGQDDRAYSISGQGSLQPGAKPTFDVQLAAKQIDLDRLTAVKVGEPADLDLAQRRLATSFGRMPKIPLAGRVRLDLAGVVLGGAVVQDVHLDARTRIDGWDVDGFEARLPGRSRFSANGRLTMLPAFGFDGKLALASDQPQALMQWWRKGSAAQLEPFQLAGRARIGDGNVRIDELQLTSGASSARGALAWLASANGKGERLKAELSADRLDLDQLRAVAGFIIGDAPLIGPAVSGADIDVDAGALVVSGQVLKGVAAKAVFEADAVKIERLSIRDAGGAAIDIKGAIDKWATTPDGSLIGTVRADHPEGVARLLEALGGASFWSRQFALAAPALGPLSATARLVGHATADSGDIQIFLDGKAGTTTIAANGRFKGTLDQLSDGDLNVTAKLEGPDGGLLLRQLGLTAMSDASSPGRISVQAKGTLGTGLTVSGSGDLAATKFDAAGHVAIGDDNVARYDGDLTLTGRDLVPLATMFGQLLPAGGAAIPLTLKAKVVGTGADVAVRDLVASMTDTAATGTLDLDISRLPIAITGDVRLTSADMTTLLELGLGADALSVPPTKGNAWPTAVLAGPLVGNLAVDIGLAADQLSVDPARRADRFATRLRLRPGEVHFDEMSGVFAGGKLTGALGITARSSQELALAGNLQLTGAALADIVWRRDGRAVADGTFNLTTTFETDGRSLSALAANMSGNGAVTVTDGVMRYVDPQAFGAIISAADSGLELKDDKIRTVFQGRLDAGTLPFERLEAAFAIGAGVLRVRDVSVTAPSARTTGSVSFDFGRWTMDADWTLKVDAGKNSVVGAEPQVGVLFRGPLDAPKRTLDVSPLSAFLTLRSFEREVQRIEALQQDIMERDRFARELKRLKDERARRDQEAKAAEQRKADEARRQEEQRKAEEQRRLDEARKAEDARKADEARKAEELRRADELRKAAKGDAPTRKPPVPPVGDALPPLPPPVFIAPDMTPLLLGPGVQ